MIYFLKHFKGIAYFLIMLILFQSCVVYNKNPSTIEEASSEKKTHIKILTKDGHEHEFRWIEEKDGNIYTVTHTQRVFVKKNKVERYVVMFPHAAPVPLDFAVEHKGIVYIDTQKDATYDPTGKGYKYSFIDIEDRGDFIRGIKMTGKDTATVMIPIEQIEEIKLMNSFLSHGVPIMISVIIIIGCLIGYELAKW